MAGYLTFWYGRAGLDGIPVADEQVPEALDTALMVSAGSTYVGWLWWSVVACVNARRIAPSPARRGCGVDLRGRSAAAGRCAVPRRRAPAGRRPRRRCRHRGLRAPR
ncbi:MAG: hypothetical protein R2713_06165 [Ilumatobacteraceae bacterium]